jgi:hypothetical protein
MPDGKRNAFSPTNPATAWLFDTLAVQLGGLYAIASKMLYTNFSYDAPMPNIMTWHKENGTKVGKAPRSREKKMGEKCKNLELRRIHTRGDSYYVRLEIQTH